MASVIDVAKYIVDKLGTVDTWKLQKLIYYCQAWSLVWDEKPLFNERIEAWANGPVCPRLYQLHKGRYEIGPETPIWDDAKPEILLVDEQETINSVLDYYGNRPGYWLRELTHLEDPWIQARGGLPLREPSNNEITNQTMRLYYGSL